MTDDPRRAPGADLPQWVDHITALLGVKRSRVDLDRLLDLSSEVAHGVARPAVPVTMFVAGLAAADLPADEVVALLDRVERAAVTWTAAGDDAPADGPA
ncbi:DUF6457 domain-containing protein [Cellulomonas composti]|uniref:DUF6457 domain-containing protein n=1 Tax=Cellulomonas composti TaxID=266130 RepID=A0A511J857_9CELL|nr:DUF6457 domain-containing protein [Cellulomonas composti]GEL94186.1 hypothetical protein CCO02nite_08440 [Cellulomonas composti]